ncbi:MAG: FAD-dependent oxidoreductase [Clostridiaceae bacterium]|nr:FAD-dependent oxidoreductase [Clostridiaceae bacterium]
MKGLCMSMENNYNLHLKNKYDIIIAGGGTAGVIAAIAAARSGAKTLLVERWGHVGGTAVFGIPFLGMFDCKDKKVVSGIPGQLVERMVKEGGSIGYTLGGKWADENYHFSLAPFEPETYKYVAQEMLLEAGASVLLHTFIMGAVVEDGQIKAIKVCNKSGVHELCAKVIIDCTGDADVAFMAGAPMQDKEQLQNVTIIFRMGNVDIEKFVDALKNSRGVSGWNEWHTRLVTGKKIGSNTSTAVHIAGHFALVESQETTFTAVSVAEGEVYINATRTIKIDGSNAEDLSRGEIMERRNVHSIVKQVVKKVPGFEKARLLSTSPLGIRESRNIVGEYILTKEDVIGGRVFEDAVARGAYPIDIHDPKGGRTRFTFIKDGGSYTIPYRCFLPLKVEGLLVAGRCLSATHEALGSARIMGTVMAQGEAVGTAAALAVIDGLSPRKVDINKLRNVLRENGAIVD